MFEDEAFVTLATTDGYAFGALVLGLSLRKVNTTRKLVVMVSSNISQEAKQMLDQIFDLVQTVDVLNSNDEKNLRLLTRPDLGITFTKLRCWLLTQYKKAVFMDSDTLVLQNIDDIFDREELSAAPDPGWPDCFNSGVFVFQPSNDTYHKLLEFSSQNGSFDGGDQGLLNQYFNDWSTKDIRRHLPFTYNCIAQNFYSYMPAWKKFENQVRVLHFIGPLKPWHHTFDLSTGKVQPCHATENQVTFLQYWWDLFVTVGKGCIDKITNQIDNRFVQLNLTEPEIPVHVVSTASCEIDVSRDPACSNITSVETDVLDDRRQAWECGAIDYLGSDNFESILDKINETLNRGSDE